MNQLVPLASPPSLPSIVVAAGESAQIRFLEFFAASIRNTHTRRAYAGAVGEFLIWCEGRGVASITAVQPLHVAAYIETLSRSRSAPTAKQRLAAIRRLFDWLVIGQVIPTNPAASVRGPSHSVRRGKTPVLDPTEARQLLDAIDVATPAGLRDRALIGLMVFSFARIGAALAMRVEDVYIQNRRLWVRLHEKGGKRHDMPCHHSLETYLDAYLDGCDLRRNPKAPLFRTLERGRGVLTSTPLPQANAYAMIGRRAAAAGITTRIGAHTFRATGITAYLKNGGTLETAAAMANHASTRTTQLYDRRSDQVSLDEIERVRI
ncbi:MAG: tyrosine-type recombinase/integrase [Caulobacteraceae bacterium]|nr:tyrosine-type recombinase/integrase [Caulobacteraceae bacterium]